VERASGNIRNTIPVSKEPAPRRLRADAQRNVDALLEAAKEVFAQAGVDAPAKDVAGRAGVGVGTLYRHFPQRSDLVVAVLEREIDALADAGPALAADHAPGAALTAWLERYTELVAAKRGLAAALHSGDPAFDALPGYFWARIGPAAETLLDAARAAGEVRADVDDARALVTAVSKLCHPVAGEDPAAARRMVGVLVDGLRA
jgi:AcrR family transcriptional regulator